MAMRISPHNLRNALATVAKRRLPKEGGGPAKQFWTIRPDQIKGVVCNRVENIPLIYEFQAPRANAASSIHLRRFGSRLQTYQSRTFFGAVDTVASRLIDLRERSRCESEVIAKEN